MTHITPQGYIDIPPVSQPPLPNPLFGYNGDRTAPPSISGSSRATRAIRSTLKHQVLLYDQHCLVTGTVSTQLQACCLISPIHVDDSNRGEKGPLKDAACNSCRAM